MGIPMKDRGLRKHLTAMMCVAVIATLLSACGIGETQEKLLLEELVRRGFTEPALVSDMDEYGSGAQFAAGLGTCRVTITWNGRYFAYGELVDIDAARLSEFDDFAICRT